MSRGEGWVLAAAIVMPSATAAVYFVALSSTGSDTAANPLLQGAYAGSKVLQQGTPELGRAVEEGRVSVSAAAELTGLPREEQVEIAAGGKKEAAARAKERRVQKAGRSQGQGAGSR